MVTEGVYLCYCVEIDLIHLSLNTISLSDELKSMDAQTSALIGDLKDNESLDELVGAKTAFRALKTLVMGWLEDVWATNNIVSDALL